MDCPECRLKLYLAHRPVWLRPLRWIRLYYCARCKKKYVRLKWGED